MDFIPYSCQHITAEDVETVGRVLRSEFLSQGPMVPEFERAFADRHRTAYAVAVSSATAALHCALMGCGVGAGAKVWTTPITFVASANCALYCGAEIDFVDTDARTHNLSVSALEEKLSHAARTGELPAAVVVVDFSGFPADMREIRRLADRYGFKIVEDASHATGASYLGRPVGSVYSDATVFSFHAVKIITTGEGGMILTNDAQLAHRLRRLRSHGITRDHDEFADAAPGAWYYEQQSLGFNYRMTEMQAALGVSQLRRLSELRARRDWLADRYDDLLGDLPLILPVRMDDRESAWHLYVVEIDEHGTQETRAAVFDRMRAQRIGVNVHYIPVHLQPFYKDLGFHRGQYPASEHYYDRALSIPLFPALTEAQQDWVAEALRASIMTSTEVSR